MDVILNTLQKNVIIVSSMDSYPTTQIRILSDLNAVLPILAHDNRPLPQIQRYLSDDSRTRVCAAIDRTMDLLSDLLLSADTRVQDCLSSVGTCELVRGLEALCKSYKHDATVVLEVRRIRQKWATLVDKIQSSRASRLPVATE
jgi:hypothetical protein